MAKLVLAMTPVSMRSVLLLACACALAVMPARSNEDVAVCGGFVKLAPELLGCVVSTRVRLCTHRIACAHVPVRAPWAWIAGAAVPRICARMQPCGRGRGFRLVAAGRMWSAPCCVSPRGDCVRNACAYHTLHAFRDPLTPVAARAAIQRSDQR